jgi:glycosyltransferase involved in cell wall biosynthesis
MSERVQQFDNENLGTISKYVRQFYVPTLESNATRVADHVITVSEKDVELMESLNGVPRNKLTVIPNGAEPINETKLANRTSVRDEFDLTPDTSAIVFHGNYETGTHNREAAERIIDRIAPRFRDRDDVEFFIIGNGAPETELPNVTPLGFVEDLYSTLNAMDIAIVPLTSGTATKLKMFDYMSVGVPIVSTEKGTEGIDLQDGVDVIVSEVETDQFVEEIQRILNDEERREQIGNNGRRLIEERYNWRAIGKRLDDVYTGLRANQ